jgi:hypothetical protein
MSILIVFGPGPDRAETAAALIRANIFELVLLGTTVEEVLAYDRKLRVQTISNCTVVFAHYIPGKMGMASTEEECMKWKDILWAGVVKHANKLSAQGFTRADMPLTMNLHFAKEDSSGLFTFTWEGISTMRCISFARAVENAYSEVGGDWSTRKEEGEKP